ncbi:MAG: hypothetical protein IT306_17695 [Chloroflexi bacterium]|nr:hypothetical protein [Chloroflexota bacterium]
MSTYVQPRAAFLIGLTGAFVGMGLRSLILRAGRPVAVAAVREAIAMQETAMLRWNELSEDVADIRAQARHDLHGDAASD